MLECKQERTSVTYCKTLATANNIGGLLQNSGSAQAANYMAQGKANANQWGAVGDIFGQLGGAALSKVF